MAQYFFDATPFEMESWDQTTWYRQTCQPFVDYRVDVDTANRRFRVIGDFKLRMSWAGYTSLTARDMVAQVGSTVISQGNYTLYNPSSGGYDWNTGPNNVTSEWFAFDDQGKPTVSCINLRMSFYITPYTRPHNTAPKRYDMGPSGAVCVNVSIPPISPAYSEVGTPALNCYGSTASPNIGSVGVTCSPGYGTQPFSMTCSLFADAARTQLIATKTSSSSSTTFSFSGLQPNTRYYSMVTASNGYGSAHAATCSFVTLCGNTLTNVSLDAEEGVWRVAIQGGNGVYPPNTAIRFRPCSGGAWVTGGTTSTKTVDEVEVTGTQELTCYQFQACTTTTAGTYCGNIVQMVTPEKDRVKIVFDKVEPTIGEGPHYDTSAEICYSVQSNCTPSVNKFYYRVKDSLISDEWILADTYELDEETGQRCITLDNLFPNQTIYEIMVCSTCGKYDGCSEVVEFITPLMPKPENYNCENFQYLTDLLCQAVTALPDGLKTIYANPTSKELCDPNSDNPTLATLWSRLMRFNHAAACLLCDMVDSFLRGGKDDQYLTGETGWTTMVKDFADDFEGDVTLASSDAIYQYIQKKLHSVWHMHGSVDYLVGKSSELPDTAPSGSTAIVAELNQIWRKTNDGWAIDQDLTDEIDDFSVYHINNRSDTSFGTVLAGSAYYQFGGTWNSLDADIALLERTITILMEADITTPPDGKNGLLVHVKPKAYDPTTEVCDSKDHVYFMTEPLVVPSPGYHLIVFTTGPNATLVQNQEVLDGALAQAPTAPQRTGYTFVEWEDENALDTPFNWSLPIKKDYSIVAKWEPLPVVVDFDINGGEGTTPTAINTTYGSTIGLPSDETFHRDGATFAGWMRDGVPFNDNDIIVGDTTLVAMWHMDEFDVTFHPNNGGADTVIHLTYGSGVNSSSVPTPTKANSIFTGWYTAAASGVEFDFSQQLYGPTEVFAHYIPSHYTVDFDMAGGTPQIPAQSVPYQGKVTEPSTPSQTDMVFGWWMKEGKRYLFIDPVTEAFTLTARWLHIYTVEFVDSFGETVWPNQTIVEGEIINNDLNPQPTRDGYTFDGWYTSDGQKWDVEVDTVQQDMTLTAIFTKDAEV